MNIRTRIIRIFIFLSISPLLSVINVFFEKNKIYSSEISEYTYIILLPAIIIMNIMAVNTYFDDRDMGKGKYESFFLLNGMAAFFILGILLQVALSVIYYALLSPIID